ncbi:MAG: YDG domain-containing protein, partial [Oscillospiraceae bacterium]
ITVRAKPKATGTAANGAKFTPPGANQMALFLDTVQLCAPVGPVSGVYTMTYNTAGKGLPPGYNTITAKYVGNDTMADATGDVSVTLLPKDLDSKRVSVSREYDGSANFVNVPLTLTGVLGSDNVTATADGTTSTADKCSDYTFNPSSITLGGADARYYTLPLSNVSGSVDIKKKPVTVTVTAQDKVYNGKIGAQVTCAVIGKVGTDDVTTNDTFTAVFADKNVGVDKTVTVTGIGLRGTKLDNYALNNTTATTTANITKKPIAWNEAGKVKNKDYDGSPEATVAKLPTLIGVVSGDDVTVKNGTVTFANANVGTHAITATGFGIEGAGKDNYIAPTGQPTFAKGEIKAKKITPTVTVSDAYTFTGSQIRPAADQIVVKDGTATVIPATDYTVSYGENINVTTGGSVTVNLKGNYSGTGTGNFAIGKA